MNPILKISTTGQITTIPRATIYDNPPVPVLAVFQNCEGVHCGKPVGWLGKAFRVVVTGKGGYTVMPNEILMAIW